MKDLIVVEHANQRILTTAQIARFYEADIAYVNTNFQRNKDRFTLGKHYFVLEGEELKRFKSTTPLKDGNLKFAPILYLWTEKGAALHAKILSTDKAWEFYENLVDEYYRLVKEVPRLETQEQIFTKDVQSRCIRNEKLLPSNYWCVVTEMWREAWTLEAFQKELKPSSLPDGSCGTKWRNHLKGIEHPLLSKSYQEYLHIPNNKSRFKVWVYPYALLEYFREWLRVEYAEYYMHEYSPSRVVGAQQIDAPKRKRLS